MEALRTYYYLTKPGIIYGNLMTAAAGFIFASRLQLDPWLLLATIMGLGLIIASACVVNNYIDRGLDRRMARTRQRALASGRLSNQAALVYAMVLGLLGAFVLGTGTNWLTLAIAGLGWFFYVVMYSIWKRRSPAGTLVGSISGAVPIVVGYTAVVGTVDGAALLLFLIMALWQMPHFYAIALYRGADYRAAGLPVLPAVVGVRRTKLHILVYLIAYLMAAVALTIFGYAGYTYGLIMVGLAIWWLRLVLQGFAKGIDDAAWARRLFGRSLVVLLGFSLALVLDVLAP